MSHSGGHGHNERAIRDRVLKRVVDMLEHLRIQVSMMPETNVEVLRALERPQQFDLAEDVAKYLMEKLGHATAPKEPRFDKTRRELAKKNPRRGRGVLKPEDVALLTGTAPEK